MVPEDGNSVCVMELQAEDEKETSPDLQVACEVLLDDVVAPDLEVPIISPDLKTPEDETQRAENEIEISNATEMLLQEIENATEMSLQQAENDFDVHGGGLEVARTGEYSSISCVESINCGKVTTEVFSSRVSKKVIVETYLGLLRPPAEPPNVFPEEYLGLKVTRIILRFNSLFGDRVMARGFHWVDKRGMNPERVTRLTCLLKYNKSDVQSGGDSTESKFQRVFRKKNKFDRVQSVLHTDAKSEKNSCLNSYYNVGNDLSSKSEKKLFTEVVKLSDVIFGYVDLSLSASNEEDGSSGRVASFPKLARVWMCSKGDESEDLKSFFPLASDGVSRGVSLGGYDVKEVSGAVAAEAILLKLSLMFLGGIVKSRLELEMKNCVVGSIIVLRNHYFFEALVKKFGTLKDGEHLENEIVSLAGRVMNKRSSSLKLFLYELHELGAKVQLMSYARTYELDEAEFSKFHSEVECSHAEYERKGDPYSHAWLSADCESRFSIYNVITKDRDTYWAVEEDEAVWSGVICLTEIINFNMLELYVDSGSDGFTRNLPASYILEFICFVLGLEFQLLSCCYLADWATALSCLLYFVCDRGKIWGELVSNRVALRMDGLCNNQGPNTCPAEAEELWPLWTTGNLAKIQHKLFSCNDTIRRVTDSIFSYDCANGSDSITCPGQASNHVFCEGSWANEVAGVCSILVQDDLVAKVIANFFMKIPSSVDVEGLALLQGMALADVSNLKQVCICSDAATGDPHVIKLATFSKRLKAFYTHWNEFKNDYWGDSEAFSVAAPPVSDDLRYLKSTALNIWLLGFEFQETIMVFTRKQIHFLCNQKKASLLEIMKSASKEAVNVNVVMHVKTKNDDGATLMDSTFCTIYALSKENIPVVGHIAKAAPNVLSDAWSSFKLLNKFLATFPCEDVTALGETKDEVDKAIAELLKSPEIFQCDLLDLPAIKQLEVDAGYADVVQQPQRKKPKSLRIYEAHVGISSKATMTNTYVASFGCGMFRWVELLEWDQCLLTLRTRFSEKGRFVTGIQQLREFIEQGKSIKIWELLELNDRLNCIVLNLGWAGLEMRNVL